MFFYQYYVSLSELGSLNQGLVFELCGWKKRVWEGRPTKGGQPG